MEMLHTEERVAKLIIMACGNDEGSTSWMRGTIKMCATFFSEVLQFGSCTPLPKTDLEENKTAPILPDEKCHALSRYTTRIVQNKVAYYFFSPTILG